MRRPDSDLGVIVAPDTLSLRVRIAVDLYFRLVIWAGNNPTPAPRNDDVAGQEVREPCLVRVVCMDENCHRESVLLCLGGAERRGRTRGRLTLQTLASESTPAMRIA
jgi:hypothetical protein